MTSRRSPRPCYRRATTPRRFTRSVGQGRRRHHRRRLWPQPAARVGAWWCDPRSAAECEPVFARFPLTIRVPEHLGHFLQGGNQRKFMHQAAQTPGASKATAAETRCRFPSAHLGATTTVEGQLCGTDSPDMYGRSGSSLAGHAFDLGHLRQERVHARSRAARWRLLQGPDLRTARSDCS